MRGIMKGIQRQTPEEREKSFAENGYYVTTFTTAKQVGTVYICNELDSAKSASKYYRNFYPSVRILTREELHAIHERETEERRKSYEYFY